MAVTFTATKAILAAQATALAAEATTAGLSALATALTNLSSEISGQNPTEREFLGGGYENYSFTGGGGGSGSGEDWDSAAMVWSSILTSAAQVIRTKIANNVAADVNAIATDIDAIATDIDTIATKQTVLAEKTTDIRDYQLAIKNWAENDGIHVKSPWEYLGVYSIIRYFEEEGIDYSNARAIVESKLRHRQ